ncbi:PucR family transcriptional regulator [Streptomyces griseus]|uniref:PucR family transcriptional regulator n=1 Tax=Streptomyces griseus TaxID=1911 RepID=UPI000560197C|nr:PucR family transcriptional regulator [Streptomyces griseus]
MEETSIVPDPTVPPTPPVPLTALLTRGDLGLRRIAGPAGGDVAIHGAHSSEMADPSPYLLGGELLLTAGAYIPEAAGPESSMDIGFDFDGYVSRIVEAGGAALGFGLAPVHDSVPGALVTACDTHGLPLLQVPPRTTFSGVARAVWQLMAQARHAELRRVTEAQQSLAAAASHPDPVPSVLGQLARRIGGWAVLYDPEGTEIATAGRTPEETVSGALRELTSVLRQPTQIGSPAPTPSSATDTVAGTRLAAYVLGAGQGFVLGVAAAGRESGDHTIASVAAVLLSLLTGEQQSGSGAARSSALVRLLLGGTPEEVAPMLGGGRWMVVHAAPHGRRLDAVAASALGAALGTALVDLTADGVRLLVAEGREVAAPAGWTLGVSAPAGPGDWPAADAQAARALARARATRTPLVRHGGRPALADLVPPDEAETHARALLAPITGAGPALAGTLRTWLSLHGSWDRTAVALSVHRNTVRQRIARCAALLGADLDDPDVRMELWFALGRL